MGILNSQRILAEIIELEILTIKIHASIVNLKPDEEKQSPELVDFNKKALLIGDFFQAKINSTLADLNNSEVYGLVWAALRNKVEAELIEPRDEQYYALPAPPNPREINVEEIGHSPVDPLPVKDLLGSAEAEWTLRTLLSYGTLLGNFCQSTLLLAAQPKELQKLGYVFGKHFALALQAYLDCQPFQKPYDGPFSLLAAPLLFQLEHNPNLYSEIERGRRSIDDINYETLHDAVIVGSGVAKTRQLVNKHLQTSGEILDVFKPCEAKDALRHLMQAMQLS